MNDLSPMSDLIADDLFLDRLAGRVDAGSEPLAGLLGALATQADTPLPSRTGRRRISNKHRYLGAFAVLAVAASGAGVAAAVTLPANGPSQADRARIVKLMDDSARSDAPSALLSRLGLPQTSRSAQAQGLVLVRRADGSIVLVPAAVAAAQRQAVAAGATLVPGAVPGVPGTEQAAGGRPGDPGQPGSGTNGLAQGGNGQAGNGQGGNGQTGTEGTTTDQGDQGATQTGTPPGTNNGKKPAGGTKGGKKPTPSVTPTPTEPPSSTNQLVAPQTTLAPSTTARTSTNTTSKATPTAAPKATPKAKVRGTAPGSTGASGSTSDSVSTDPNGSSAPQDQTAPGSSAGTGGSGSAASDPGKASGNGSGNGSGKGSSSAAGGGSGTGAVGSLVDGVVSDILPGVVPADPADSATPRAAGRTSP
ncbi:hypothetical protein GCM10009721_25570 [Terrabacter tumescens]|uniref:Uncharacterized protein n=2 Tax=Terrabacter tumescens TaxID=60443 RepID=A0ABQ2I155_9MICO|nr:hypothetical protein GCM10009721_25570 [Terrabacter tumescens]